MTRFLSEALQAPEPYFRMGLERLERLNGRPNTDIRFSTDVLHRTQAKLKELGLDPHDTTPQELYLTLEQRVSADDIALQRNLQTLAASSVSAEADVVAGMVVALNHLPDNKAVFALKNSVLKAMIRKTPPKKAMKQLGYRSTDSLLKHEAPALIVAAGWLLDGESWHKKLLAQYAGLTSSDFEMRTAQLLHPTGQRWQQFAHDMVQLRRQNLLSFKEFGALIILPLPRPVPGGLTTLSMSLAIHELNQMRAASTFLQFSQVRADFGTVVRSIAVGEAELNARLLDRPLPWHLVQRYYAALSERVNEDVFGLHLRPSDMAWYGVEDTLARIEPRFTFWQGTSHLGVVHGREPLSLNLIDAAMNYCNGLSYDHRVMHFFQRSLWHELVLRYMHHEPMEQALLAELQPALATNQ